MDIAVVGQESLIIPEVDQGLSDYNESNEYDRMIELDLNNDT